MSAAVFFSARSHVGHVRRNNEDNLYCDGASLTPENRDAPFTLNGSADAPCVFAVCDGMGGEADGEFASLTAVTVLAERAKAIGAASGGAMDAIVAEYVTKTNALLCEAMRTKAVRMGTTLALAVVTDDALRAYTLGDSRVYALKDGSFFRLSEDHTLAAQKVKMGLITEEEAGRDRDRHTLTRYLGIFEDEMTVEADASAPLPIGGGCRAILCSDGLTDMVADGRIKEIMSAAPTPEEAARRLVDEALGNGGRDNVTCVVVDVKPTALAAKKLRSR
ncbi:MAG: protein phosphatase 2C domain-containing protein [Synergistaceae bacterium]|nr:protein phosphatase 2C domain-containing protein [Synergistaceae bacterium]